MTKAVEVLIKEQGPVEASQFLTLPKKRRVESVKRHRQWQAQPERDDFFDQVFSEQPSKAR